MSKQIRTLVFTETLKIMNKDGTSHDYEYQIFWNEHEHMYELVRFAYGAEQMKSPFYNNLERIIFIINADKREKIRFFKRGLP